MTDLFSLDGRVAVVTGGAGQVGGEIARGLAARGAKVASFDIAEAPDGDGVQSFVVDVTDRAAIASATAELSEVPHVLVNAAALDSPPDAPAEEVGPFEDYPSESFDEVMQVNVKGTLFACQVIGARMAEAGRGSIVNVSSIYGMLSPVQELYDFRRAGGETFFKPVAYSVSKSALYNLTRYLATYWAKSGVRVNTLTLAGVWNNQPQEFVDAYTARMPLGRMAERARGRRAGRLPDLRRVVVRHGRERRRRRRLVGLVRSHEALNLIEGRAVPAQGGDTFEKFRPADGSLVCTAARSRGADVDSAVGSARKAQRAWAARTPVERGSVVRELALRLQARREEAAAIVAEETGKSADLALGETDAAVEMGFFVAGEGRRLYGRTTTSAMPNRTVLATRRPVGVAGLIVSFNTPLPNYAWKAFPAVFCGNAAVLKPSEHTPASAAFFGELCNELLPPGVLNVVQGLGPRQGRRSSSLLTSTSSASPARRRPGGGSRNAPGAGWRRSCSSSAGRTRSSSATTQTSTGRWTGRWRRRSPTQGSAAPPQAGSSCSTPCTRSSASASWKARATTRRDR